MADAGDDRVQNRFLFTAPYISMARLYTKMAAVFPNYVIICTRNDVIENALYVYLDSHISRSLSSYGSDYTRIGVSPFDTACRMVHMRMRKFMCMRSFNVSGPFERRRIRRESDERGRGK